ncbi:U1-hexatoxin-Iw1a-like [Pomacea canaliculata]|uniref:U1-hexatoxin-Iw1a-like n=1 Tax=Pomacea canaliculata TaxID=400727 RepID=UPI000D729C6B|nr:U1-hexatoxin-Iw1a-like [Pomacea canaliculata]
MLRAYLIYFCLLVTLVVSQEKQCTRDSDCGDQECCITFGRKRFIFSSGHCKKFSDMGDACEPPELSHGTEHTFNCPCVGPTWSVMAKRNSMRVGQVLTPTPAALSR